MVTPPDFRSYLILYFLDGYSGHVDTFTASDVVIDRAQHRALVNGRDIGLLFQEFELLHMLVAHPNHVFTRDEILARAWSSQPQATSRTVDVHIHRLRRKLGPRHAGSLVTVRRVGYMFRTAVTVHPV
jgi:DNA-binding response OmpR family regulator